MHAERYNKETKSCLHCIVAVCFPNMATAASPILPAFLQCDLGTPISRWSLFLYPLEFEWTLSLLWPVKYGDSVPLLPKALLWSSSHFLPLRSQPLCEQCSYPKTAIMKFTSHVESSWRMRYTIEREREATEYQGIRCVSGEAVLEPPASAIPADVT